MSLPEYISNVQRHIFLANPRGFCAGVSRAIEIVELALKKFKPPVYVHHEIVHNKFVTNDLRKKGVIFINDIKEAPNGSVVIFSAHGVSEAVETQAITMNLHTIDATCPLVKKVHLEARKYETSGAHIVLIGHAGHAEVEGTSGRVNKGVHLVQKIEDVTLLELPSDDDIAYITQTTLSIDDTIDIIAALKKKFPNIKGPGTKDICYATQNRQDAVKNLIDNVDGFIVIGSENSSNSMRLYDIAKKSRKPVFIIDDAYDIKYDMFRCVMKIGITAGASAPEALIRAIIEKLSTFFPVSINEINGTTENIHFNIPMELREKNVS